VPDHESIAFQRGKRSCTLSDLNSEAKKSTKFLDALRSNQAKAFAGKKSADSLRSQPLSKRAGSERFQNGKEVNPQEYDFCHHCKQLKNKYLLVACKYSTRKYQPLGGASPNFHYVPYPYEPTFYFVNNVKIHNLDFQNRPQIRGLLDNVKKDLRMKNQAIEQTRQAMLQFATEQRARRDALGRPAQFLPPEFDMEGFAKQNQQLMAWL